MEYWVPALNVWLNPCVCPLTKIKISFPLLSVCTNELISTLKRITFLPMLPSGKECYPRVDTIPYPVP